VLVSPILEYGKEEVDREGGGGRRACGLCGVRPEGKRVKLKGLFRLHRMALTYPVM